MHYMAESFHQTKLQNCKTTKLQNQAQNRAQKWLSVAYLMKSLVQVAQVQLRVADQGRVLPAMLPLPAWEHLQFLLA